MPGGCKYSLPESLLVTDELKESCRTHVKKQLDNLVMQGVPRNMLTEQQFVFRLESGVESAYLWNDEITQAIAMSCVP